MKVFYFTIFMITLAKTNGNNSKLSEELYLKLFKQRRLEHIEAVKSLMKIPKYEQRYQMVVKMAENIFTVVQNSRAKIESSGFIPGVSVFPEDEDVKETLSNILENTALFSEVLLRLPDLTTSVLKINYNWDVLLKWGIAFSNQASYLLDKSTIKLHHLVSQELNHIERDPHYFNPYRKIQEQKIYQEQKLNKVNRKKQRKQVKKGPRLHNEL